MNTFPPSIELMREAYGFPGEYVLLHEDAIVAHDPDIADAFAKVPDVPRGEVLVIRAPKHESAVMTCWSAL